MTTPTTLTATRAYTVRQPYADLYVAGVADVLNVEQEPPDDLPQWWLCECGRRLPPDQVPGWHQVKGHHGSWHAGAVEPDGPFPFRLAIHASVVDESLTMDHDPRIDGPDGWCGGSHNAGCGHRGHGHYIVRGRRYCYGCKEPCGYDHLVLNVFVGTVQVDDVHHADECAEGCWQWKCGTTYCSRWAEPDRFHWEFSDPRPLDKPIPAQGLWTLNLGGR